jgi:hypothetical protein
VKLDVVRLLPVRILLDFGADELAERNRSGDSQDVKRISEETEILLRKMLVNDQFKGIEWTDLFEFVISEQGKIVRGCKKQLMIGTSSMTTRTTPQSPPSRIRGQPGSRQHRKE